jgi:hypothetical protein
MRTKNFIIGFLVTFAIAFIANTLIVIGWNYFVKSKGIEFDWETSFRISLLLAIVIPLTQIRKR